MDGIESLMAVFSELVYSCDEVDIDGKTADQINSEIRNSLNEGLRGYTNDFPSLQLEKFNLHQYTKDLMSLVNDEHRIAIVCYRGTNVENKDDL